MASSWEPYVDMRGRSVDIGTHDTFEVRRELDREVVRLPPPRPHWRHFLWASIGGFVAVWPVLWVFLYLSGTADSTWMLARWPALLLLGSPVVMGFLVRWGQFPFQSRERPSTSVDVALVTTALVATFLLAFFQFWMAAVALGGAALGIGGIVGWAFSRALPKRGGGELVISAEQLQWRGERVALADLTAVSGAEGRVQLDLRDGRRLRIGRGLHRDEIRWLVERIGRRDASSDDAGVVDAALATLRQRRLGGSGELV